MARQFETDMEESKGGFAEENEDIVENEDDKDQAKVPFPLFYYLVISVT